jgi:hypothetical protein
MAFPEFFAAFAWIASHRWLYPALEVVHIVGIALLLGSLVLVELRLLGFGSALPMAALGRFGLRLSVAAFCTAAASGAFLFLSQAEELVSNRPFLVKVGLLLVAGANAWWFHRRGGLDRVDAIARSQTLLSLGLWLAIIICGRWIAYY